MQSRRRLRPHSRLFFCQTFCLQRPEPAVLPVRKSARWICGLIPYFHTHLQLAILWFESVDSLYPPKNDRRMCNWQDKQAFSGSCQRKRRKPGKTARIGCFDPVQLDVGIQNYVLYSLSVLSFWHQHESSSSVGQFLIYMRNYLWNQSVYTICPWVLRDEKEESLSRLSVLRESPTFSPFLGLW